MIALSLLISPSLSNESTTSIWYSLNYVSKICRHTLACSTDNRSTAASWPFASQLSALVFNLARKLLKTPSSPFCQNICCLYWTVQETIEFAQDPVRRSNLCWHLFCYKLISFNTSVSGSTMDIYLNLNTKMLSFKLFNPPERSHWWQANLSLDSLMGWGSATHTTEWTVKWMNKQTNIEQDWVSLYWKQTTYIWNRVS